ncbi:hypothetical protein Pst134EA_000191 [Puccinia striiformis f. sp. tritici]|uniref:hypothetical protein n=1 Tax=Puccinia striiformis f. sp. tritici TaxID=168172 RepID=UPI0020076F0A|nr:hypothetical protein Pst134EA_000191 [Puccinia striiformis f. sp. tritici]KAH9473111.1 hypothetical protein Pst134EA_000191 [Puccinia striiformis f. sp. tritici]
MNINRLLLTASLTKNSRIHSRTKSKITLNSKPASQASSLPSQANVSAATSSPELVSSFQEPLVGLSPPLVEQEDAPSEPAKPPPLPPPKSTSLTARTNTANEFKVLPTHAFHTHRFIKQLERSKLQTESAQQILNFVESSLRSSEKRWLLTGPTGGIVSKSYAEGQAYLYNAALGELRTEVQVKARNDGIVLKSASNSVQREIDNLKQKLKLSIQELNSKFTILVSEVRTEIETRKWVTTRRCVVAIASLALCVVIFTALENPQSLSSTRTTRPSQSSSESSSSSPSSSSGSSTQPDQDRKLILKDQIMRSVEELGILPEREDPENDYHSNSANSFFNSSNTKRIGE